MEGEREVVVIMIYSNKQTYMLLFCGKLEGIPLGPITRRMDTTGDITFLMGNTLKWGKVTKQFVS